MKKILTFVAFGVFLLPGCATMEGLLGQKKEPSTAAAERPVYAAPSSSISTSDTQPAVAESAAPQFEPGLSTSQIRVVQTRLRESGYDPGPVDGVLGPKTKLAIRKYQSSNGLAIDNGIINEETLKALGVE